MKRLILILSAITLISCGTVSTGAVLKLPPELIIPEKLKISDGEWKCLSKEKFWKCPAYIKLGKRDVLKSKRIETLKGIIKSTHR